MENITKEDHGMSFLGLYLSIWFVALSVPGILSLIILLIFIFIILITLNFSYYSIALLLIGYRYYKIVDGKNSYILISNDKDIKQLNTEHIVYRLNDFTYLHNKANKKVNK